MKFIKKHWLEILFVILFIVKCWIVSVQPIMIKGTLHDDSMFAYGALRIVKGKWLGTYNDIILSKGIIGILFIAFNYKFHISYLFATHLLYFIACISFVRMLRNITKNKLILLITYVILLFNPISFSDAISYVYRDGIYMSLVLLLISLMFEVFFRYKGNLKKLLGYQILTGIVIASIYFCREETLWIIPFILVALLITVLFIIFDKKCQKKPKRLIVILTVPLIVLGGYSLIIRSINYKHYEGFIANDFTSKDFKDAYGALTRVKPTNYLKRVPLNKEDRYRLYELSPAFRELESFLESAESNKYRASIMKDGKTYEDFKEGFLYWAVREAVYKKGYYTNVKTANAYYQRLASEINNLCDSKKIECFSKRSSLVAPFQKDLIEELKKYIPKTFDVQLNYKNVLVRIPDIKQEYQDIAKDLAAAYSTITHSKVGYTKEELKSIRMKIMKFILTIFQNLNCLLFLISIIMYICIMIIFFIPKIRFKYYKQVFLLNGLLYIYLARIATVAYVAATEYESAISKCQYLSTIYPIQSVFSFLSIIFGAQILYKETRKTKKLLNDTYANEIIIADKYYTDKNNNKINLEKMSLEQLEKLNYEEETYFAQEVKKLPAFSKKRNQYLKKAYQKIFQISDYKKMKNQRASKANGVNDYTLELLKKLIKKVQKNNDNVSFYEAGVGKGLALKLLKEENITIEGCDVFLSDEAKQIDKKSANIHLVEDNLYNALDIIDNDTIDIFYADNVLEHIVDDEYVKTCEKIVSKIKKGGLAILIIPNSYVGPSDVSRLKLNIGSKAKGFHFMEQSFNEVVNFYSDYNMKLAYFCFRKKTGEIVILRNNILNMLKKKVEKKLGKIKNARNRKRLFKILGYNIYVFRKVEDKNE